MLLVGVILVLLAAAVLTYVLLATAGMTPVEISYGPLNVEVQPLWLYLAGVLTLAVAALGLWMAAAGARSKARKAKEVRELRKQAAEADRRTGRTTATDTGAAGRRGSVTGAGSSSGTAPSGTGSPGTSGGGYGAPGRPGATGTERNRLEPDR